MTKTSSQRVALTWEEVRQLYPGTAEVAYLYSAAVGLISSRVREAMTQVLTEHEQSGISAAPDWRTHASSVRAGVARLGGGRADQVAFAQNRCLPIRPQPRGQWRPGGRR